MPKQLEQKLKREAVIKFPDKGKASEKKRDAYIYGTIRKTGWKPSREK